MSKVSDEQVSQENNGDKGETEAKLEAGKANEVYLTELLSKNDPITQITK